MKKKVVIKNKVPSKKINIMVLIGMVVLITVAGIYFFIKLMQQYQVTTIVPLFQQNRGG